VRLNVFIVGKKTMRFESVQALERPLLSEIVHPLMPSSWRAKIAFELKQSRYIIKTAQTIEEFRQVIQLRTSVFLAEFAGLENDTRVDIEPRDLESDFLIIQDAATRDVLASYRLICSEFSQNFYSLSEFDLGTFLETPGKKLELSRACVHADRRSSGIFVHLLWRGLAEYVERTACQYLFGCSSIQTLDLRDIVGIYEYLQHEGVLDNSFTIRPRPDYTILDMQGMLSSLRTEGEVTGEKLLPPLLMGYLKAGARVYGAPAFDQDFSCLDLFTVLNFADLSATHLRKYLQPS
jgi:putative hemolysin